MKPNHLVLLSLLPLLALAGGCKRDNQLTTEITNSELLLPYARYLKIDKSYTGRVGGAVNPTLRSSQAFNTGYWGWNDTTAYLSGSTSLVAFATISQPLPDQSLELSYTVPFGDGTWPNNFVSTGVLRPLAITGYTYKSFDASGTDVTPTVPDTYEVGYDTQTGVISTAVLTNYTSAGVLSTKYVYTFAADPRAYSEYYQTGLTLYSGTSLSLVGSTTTAIESASVGSNLIETYTYKNYGSDGALGDFSTNSFGTANGATVVKKVVTKGTYYDATTDISADTIQTTTTSYSSETAAVYKTQTTEYFNDLTQRTPISTVEAGYTVSGSTETLATKTASYYTSGFETTNISYSVTAGSATPNLTTLTTRNTAGRPTQVVKKNSSDVIYYKAVYTYDTTGREATVRIYDVSATGTETCASGNYDMDYQTTTDTAGATIYILAKTTYPCSGAALSSTPSGKTVTTYNVSFRPTLIQGYTYSVGAFVLTSQTGYTYNSAFQVTKQQNYTVALGLATAGGYTSYNYDSNGFLTSTVSYSSSGSQNAAYVAYTYTYK
ncbi:MAG: hypothetical protein A2600_07350 [Candidatus Lambdaproteobacteria bacterium RIFOXYD1_FULL_56_27]|uniref:YD repeat-containing protein n=1 Tax=Candidatus Lambdaproteobacteria bacterium RIFOXYD2_FULL_56_26 TaxID=1817773 RepID=A0A1F6GVF8_9PROT|nr:MAG: hypothetical protein A2557_05395 [Candidatus Lambdaproteobacteria bacterium RIFOXYD2_FULL_56_26]OGH03745.1 MAG: hypothetical protein A2426_00800 [Candidatus Lambdaproteobacteria bacterium RIFOXYC1_FULL_56_13]OGH07329.1 MAG: hypothetical protein A2600_07350 [Candidatus Lambdaproteobacteria bacterium RIFOXYD1_FULL_56_27]